MLTKLLLWAASESRIGFVDRAATISSSPDREEKSERLNVPGLHLV